MLYKFLLDDVARKQPFEITIEEEEMAHMDGIHANSRRRNNTTTTLTDMKRATMLEYPSLTFDSSSTSISQGAGSEHSVTPARRRAVSDVFVYGSRLIN